MGKLSKIRKEILKDPEKWFWVRGNYCGNYMSPKIYIYGVDKRSGIIKPEGAFFNTNSYKDFVKKVLCESRVTVDIYFRDTFGNKRCREMPFAQAIRQFGTR